MPYFYHGDTEFGYYPMIKSVTVGLDSDSEETNREQPASRITRRQWAVSSKVLSDLEEEMELSHNQETQLQSLSEEGAELQTHPQGSLQNCLQGIKNKIG